MPKDEKTDQELVCDSNSESNNRKEFNGDASPDSRTNLNMPLDFEMKTYLQADNSHAA